MTSVSARFHDFIRIVLICSAALLGCALISASGLLAQTPSDATALRARQIGAIERIEAAAAGRGSPGSPEHTATLRAGLPALGNIVDGFFDFEARLAGIATESPQPLDADAAFQRRLAARYAAARASILMDRTNDQAGGRVVGGTEVRDPDFGSIVAIVQTGLPDCTGTYLGNGRVLTAAHCVCDLWLTEARRGWHVVFADKVPQGILNGRVERPLAIDASKTTIFPEVDGATSDFCSKYRPRRSVTDAGVDLAMLTIPSLVPATFPTTTLADVRGLEATLAEDDDLARPFQVVGFGASWDGNSLRVTGRKHAAFILRGERCTSTGKLGSDAVACLPDKELSAFDISGRDTCYADSGGPLLIKGDGPKQWRIVGVTSRSLKANDRYCGGGGIYVLLTAPDVIDWMRKNGAPVP
jgi:hypothetical protein